MTFAARTRRHSPTRRCRVPLRTARGRAPRTARSSPPRSFSRRGARPRRGSRVRAADNRLTATDVFSGAGAHRPEQQRGGAAPFAGDQLVEAATRARPDEPVARRGRARSFRERPRRHSRPTWRRESPPRSRRTRFTADARRLASRRAQPITPGLSRRGVGPSRSEAGSLSRARRGLEHERLQVRSWSPPGEVRRLPTKVGPIREGEGRPRPCPIGAFHLGVVKRSRLGELRGRRVA